MQTVLAILRKTSKSLWPVTSWADLLFCLKNKTSVPSCSTLTQCPGVYCHRSTTSRRAFRASIRQCYSVVEWKLKICFNSGVIFKLMNTYLLLYSERKLQKLASCFSQAPAGVKSKTLQCSEQYGLIVEAKWISCLDSLILQRIYQGRSNYTCLIVVQARTEHLIKTPWFCMPELIIHSSKLPSALK